MSNIYYCFLVNTRNPVSSTITGPSTWLVMGTIERVAVPLFGGNNRRRLRGKLFIYPDDFDDVIVVAVLEVHNFSVEAIVVSISSVVCPLLSVPVFSVDTGTSLIHVFCGLSSTFLY